MEPYGSAREIGSCWRCGALGPRAPTLIALPIGFNSRFPPRAPALPRQAGAAVAAGADRSPAGSVAPRIVTPGGRFRVLRKKCHEKPHFPQNPRNRLHNRKTVISRCQFGQRRSVIRLRHSAIGTDYHASVNLSQTTVNLFTVSISAGILPYIEANRSGRHATRF